MLLSAKLATAGCCRWRSVFLRWL